ncbi:MAG: hypothetical protein LBO72_10790 [Helicobacteraceae bacterium]|nr:hypothetical protein [Helicobacteraceae bacterium]
MRSVAVIRFILSAKEGKVYATGDNEYGQLGLDDKTLMRVPLPNR